MRISTDKRTILRVISEAVSSMTGTNPASLDAEYEKAVSSGDTETALRMVREAAAKAMPNTKVVDKDGLPLVVYHGSSSPLRTFDTGRIKYHRGTEGLSSAHLPGFYFTPDERIASEYGKPQIFFIDVENPFHGDDDIKDFSLEDRDKTAKLLMSQVKVGSANPYYGNIGEQDVSRLFDYYNGNKNVGDWYLSLALHKIAEYTVPPAKRFKTEADELWDRKNAGEIPEAEYSEEMRMLSQKADDAERIRNQEVNKAVLDAIQKATGKDGVILNREINCFSSKKIKSADVTYDDSGILIPLSKRFDFSNPDIRY